MLFRSLVLLFNCTQGPVGFGTEVGLNPNFIPSVINPFLGNENFMDSLHIINKGICQKQDKRIGKEASKVCLRAYHGQIPLQGQKKLWLFHFLQDIHVLGKQEWALQSPGHMIGMASLEFPNRGIPG